MAGNGWKTYTIGELKADTDSAIAIGPFGSRMKSNCYTSNGVPVIRGNNISNSQSFVGNFVYITDEKADELRSSNVFPDDLVFPHRGAIGEVGIVPHGQFDRYILSSSLMKLTCNRILVEPLYLFYFFRSALGRHELLKNASTVGTPGIGQPLSSLKAIKIPVPPLKEQKTIAHILGTLDDKIELNQRMNETLEAMARAIFKSWFVDFDPVRANMDNRKPLGMDAATAVLFPNRFMESELGKIPYGWRCCRWGEISTLEYGKSLRGYEDATGQYRVFGTNGPIGWHEEFLCPNPGIVIGRKGAYRGVHFSPEPFFVIDTAFYLKPKDFIDITWAYYEILRSDINSMDSGSAIPSTSREDFYSILTCAPPSSIQKQFGAIVGSLFKKKYASEHESGILATVRDTLLPKLLSGKLSMKEAEKFVEARV